MIDYTSCAVEKVKTDLKRAFLGLNISLQLLYIAYLVYAIVASVGNLIANIVLAALSVVYMIFYIFFREKANTPERQRARRIYSWSKLLVTAFTAGIAVYGLCVTATNVTVPAVILVSLMVVAWVLRFVLEAFICFFEFEANFILEGVKTDISNVTKPFRTVGNTVKRLVSGDDNEEPESESKPNVYRRILDKKVEEKRTVRHEKNTERMKKIFSFIGANTNGGEEE